MADTTTVKVHTSTRDFLLELGVARRHSADQVIRGALTAMRRDERRSVAAAEARAIKEHVGDELAPGRVSNFDPARVMINIYFAALLDTAVWGAELAAALAGQDQPGYVYEVEPTGPFEDDPNVTNKKSPGIATQSYLSRHPLRVTRQVRTFQRHDRAALDNMLHALRLLREQGRDVCIAKE